MKRTFALTTAALLLLGTIVIAQPGSGAYCGGNGKHMGMGMGPGQPGMMHDRGMGRGIGRGMGRGMRGGDGAGLHRILMLADELKLTADQRSKLEKMATDFRIQVIDQEAALKKAQVRLTDLMRNEDAPTADVNRAIDEVAKLRADMQKMRYAHLQTVRGVLTDAQKAELKEMRQERRGMRWFDDDDNDDEPEAPAPPNPPRGPGGSN